MKNIKFNIYILNIVLIFILQFKIYDLNISILIYNLNTNLLNGLFLIHPILIYIFYSIFFYINLKKFNIYINIKYKWVFFINSIYIIKKNIKKNLYLIIIAISLGAWWAFQELNWGTWWNWDLVEIINLYYIILILILNHKNFIWFIKKFKNNLIYVNIFIFILTVRYNLIQSIHNFILINNFNQYLIYIYIFILFFILKFINNKYINKLIKNNSNYIFFIKNIIFSIIILNVIITINSNYLNNLIYIFIKIFLLNYIFILLLIWLFNINLIKNKINNYFYFSLLSNEITIISNIYQIYWIIRIEKLKHLIVFIFLILIILNKLSYNINNNILNLNTIIINFKLTDNVLYNNLYIYKNFTIHFNEFNSNIILNNNIYNNLLNIDEYNTQISKTSNNSSYWLEYFNNNKYIYIYLYLLNFIIYTFILFFKFILNYNFYTRKIY